MAVRPGLQFSSETKCATLEIFHYASLTKPHWAESTVDDVTLPRWVDMVRLSDKDIV
jgi:hypothetical protein